MDSQSGRRRNERYREDPVAIAPGTVTAPQPELSFQLHRANQSTSTHARHGLVASYCCEHARNDRHRAVHHHPIILGAMGGPQAMIGWVLGLVIAVCDGLVWAELGAAMPGSGGSYHYLLQAYGPNKDGPR
jgi:hypothetical protein